MTGCRKVSTDGVAELRHLTRRKFLRSTGLAAAAVGGFAVTGSTGYRISSTLAFQEAAAGELVYASARGLPTFDPRLVQNIEDVGLMQLVCEPLIRMGANMELTPGLATNWEATDDRTWTLTLQEGVTFHNGEPFDATAVKFSIDEYRRAGETYPWFYLWPGELPEVEVVDAKTVHLQSTTPIPAAPRNLAMLFMLPPQATADSGFGEHPIGTGPYLFVEHQKDVRLVLQSNASYWGTPATIETLNYRPIPDPSARMVSVQTGEIDIAGNIPPDLVQALRDTPDLTIFQVPGVRIAHYPFNFRNTASPIADVRVRRALGYAIDGQAIIDAILAGAGQPLLGPVPAILAGAADLGGYPAPDPEQAKTLLAEAGYPDDYELILIFSAGEFIKDREVTEVIQGQLAEAGVNLKIEELEAGAYNERRSGSDWDIAINGFSAMNGDPNFFLSWATGPTTFGYANQGVKDKVALALVTTDEAQRSEILNEAQRLYWDDVPYLWGYTQTDTVAIRNRITGVEPLSTGWIPLQNAKIAG